MADKVNCVVTYPKTEADDVNNEGFYMVDLPQNVPVVLLLGWAGSLDKHLAKYSAIYEEMRCITIRYTAPTLNLFFHQGKLKELSKGVLDTLFDNHLQEHPIFIHLFSNGGAYVYSNITHLIHNDPKYKLLKVKGCIIDSAPGKRRIFKAASAFMTVLRVNTVLKYILGGFLVVYLFVSYLVFHLINLWSSDSGIFLYESLLDDPGRWPQMFLYSMADNVILYQDIEDMVEYRKRLGVSVTTNCWKDSPHVAHFPRHKESYVNLCKQFVRSCLTSSS